MRGGRSFSSNIGATPELFLVARLGRRIAGYSITRMNWRGAELESIAVDPQYRRRGVAQALLNATIERLEGANACGSWWKRSTHRRSVSISNSDSRAFEKSRRYYGEGRDAWRMRLML